MKKKNLTESTSVVQAKDPSKVKLENFHNSRVLEMGWIMRTLLFEGLRFL